MNTIGIVYAISEAAGNNCFNLIRDLAPRDINVIAFSDPHVSAFKMASSIQNQEERINVTAQILYNGVEQLALNGATVVVLAANSVHVAFDRLCEMVKLTFPNIEILSIVDAVADKCKRYRSVVIFGSNATINSKIYHQKLERENVAIHLLSNDEQAFVHGLISSGYTPSTIPHSTHSDIHDICQKAKAKDYLPPYALFIIIYYLLTEPPLDV